jgi:hypothetical protein
VRISLEEIARALNGKIRNGQVIASGPGHSSADKSLSVTLSDTEECGFVVKSFAGDSWQICKDFVSEKLGLPPFKPKERHHRSSGDLARLINDAIASQTKKPKGRLTDAYPYTDANDQPLYEVLRYEPKTFRQRQPDGKGGWIWKLNDRRVIYRWPELLKFPSATVFVTEGEKDADRLWSIDLCATTVASGSWTQECIEALRGRDCIVLEDNDKPGHDRALAAAQALDGTANTIRIVLLPGLPEGKDVSDWLDMGHSKDELINTCFDAPLCRADVKPSKDETPRDSATNDTEKPKPAYFTFLDITAWQDQLVPEREWTVRDRIPANNVTLLSGEGSVGKSILALQLSTAVILGLNWLGVSPEPGPVLAVHCEEDAPELWRRRRLFRQAGHTTDSRSAVHGLADPLHTPGPQRLSHP